MATEGFKTEPSYFKQFNTINSTIRVTCVRHQHKSAPLQILRILQNHLKLQPLRPRDEAWVVLDRDSWRKEDLDEVFRWSTTKPGYGLAVSNPNFEYWLLLHFEDGHDVHSTQECIQRLLGYMPSYTKSLRNFSLLELTLVHNAVTRAETRDQSNNSWPDRFGATTVYKLVKKLLVID